jgi:hypothetical protein
MNLYAYTGGDPVNGTDPMGLLDCTGAVPSFDNVSCPPRPIGDEIEEIPIHGERLRCPDWLKCAREYLHYTALHWFLSDLQNAASVAAAATGVATHGTGPSGGQTEATPQTEHPPETNWQKFKNCAAEHYGLDSFDYSDNSVGEFVAENPFETPSLIGATP